MRAARRLCALVVVLALLPTIPPGQRGCVQCPPGCPMHARTAGGKATSGHRLGCHRGPRSPGAALCLRSTCGHDLVTESPVAWRAILAEPAGLPLVPASARLVPASARVASLAAPEPPTEPPRVLRG